MYYITNHSVDSSENIPVISDNFPEAIEQEIMVEELATCKEPVFCQADLWNLHKHSKTIHVTDRLPRTWEGLW